MSVKVQKYLLNMAKSVVYSTSDVLSEKFTYAKDFKNENREVFNEVYHSVKDYRTTFARLKKTITDNKIVDAARVGFDSVLYSITTGDFYAKSKETEVTEKYSGSFMQGMDIDDEDFDFSKKDDVSEGDMVIATAVKKNSKLQTAFTTEAIAKTGKAQMDVSKENTMLLYTQNERLINKLDGGLTNITEFLKKRDEESAKVQNKMNENMNKFMTNVDNNIVKLTAQMDELLEMQRNMYKPVKPDEKKKNDGFYDIIDRSGVINIKAYASTVKKQAVTTILDQIPGASMLFGDLMGEGSNMLAQLAANPTRALSNSLINKALGKGFDAAAKDLNRTMELIIPNVISKLYAQGKKEDNGIMGLLGKIFGLKMGSNESINPGAYQKGAIPFDGITKKAIIEVIPTYLRKMASALTGGEEMAFDYNTGRWTSMRTVNKQYSDLINAERNNVANAIKQHYQSGMNGRSFDSMYSTKEKLDKANAAVNRLALKLAAAGDFGSINVSDLDLEERTLYEGLQSIWRKSASKENKDIWVDSVNNKEGKIRRRGPSIAEFNAQLRSSKVSHNQAIKQLNETGGIAILAAQEGLSGDVKNYFGKSYVDGNGDISERRIQELPMTQALIRGKDQYGHTIYDYLRNIGTSVTVIKAYSENLQNLPFINNNGSNNGNPPTPPDVNKYLNGSNEGADIDYTGTAKKDIKFASEYYKKLREEEKKKANEAHEKAVKHYKESARKKGETVSFATSTNSFRSEGDDIGIHRLLSDAEAEYESSAIVDYQKEEEKKKQEKWKKLEDILGKEHTDKLKKVNDEYDDKKTLNQNLANAKTTTEKILVMGKWFTQKTNVNAMEKVTNTIIKTDAWLKDLIYGNDLKPEDEKKSLWQLMKSHTEKFFTSVKDMISEHIVKPIRKWYEDSWLQKGMRKIFGKQDSMGNIEEEGLLSYFISGFKKGMHKNADEVREIYKEEARKAKEAAERAGIIKSNDEEDSDSSSNGSSSGSNNNPPTPPKPMKNKEKDARHKSLSDLLIKYNRLGNLEALNNERTQINKKIRVINEKIQDIQDAMSSYEYYDNTFNSEYRRLNNKMVRFQAEKEKLNKRLAAIQEIINKMDVIAVKYNKTAKRLIDEGESITLLPVTNDQIRTMASGGINLTGRSFKSVLSPGEMVISGGGVSKVGSMGVYNIPAGATVVNPASKATQSAQAIKEKNFARGLRYNANTDDELEPIESDEDRERREESERRHQEAIKRIEQVDIDKLSNWETLTDSKQRAAFLGNMASRGVIGSVAGLLVGGPLLGAAVGAASSLTKSTDAFGEFLFGKAERDANGDIIRDNHGNPKRADDGLISKELQNAAPDMSKLGLVGLGAGILTGLGPLAGLMLGSGLGFAKNAEAFQGTLFGEGGIISDENITKLKKGAKNMGIGAATAALFLPGPFGLVGSALIGATAGYATSTDKFKDFLLGEEDADGKRKGGVKGALMDNVVYPLKDFGSKIVDKTLDELFGPEGEDGKRNTDEGLFGTIRANVIKPMVSGAQSIFKQLTNAVEDIKDFTVGIIKKFREYTAGNSFLTSVFEKAGKIGSGVIGFAGKVGRAATKPFRLLGDEGIGGHFKKKRIKKGRADDMTARERLKARGDFGMSAVDEWSEFDNLLINLNHEDKQSLLNILSYDENGKDIEKLRNDAYKVLGQELRKNVSNKESKKILRMIKDGRAKDIERYLDTRNIDETARKNVMKEIADHKTKMERAQRDYAEMDKNRMSTQQYLLSKGINVDISDARKLKNLKKMTERELAHDGVGLTDEEIAWQNEKNFWNGAETPLKTVNEAATNMEKMLEMIHYDLTIGDNYDKLSDSEKSEYKSKEDYINKIKKQRIEGGIIREAGNNQFSPGKYNKIGSLDVNAIKQGDALTNDIWNDFLPFYTGDLKGVMDKDNRLRDLISNELNTIIETACQMFDGLALKELCVAERIKDDITRYTNKIMQAKQCTEEEARAAIKTMRREITIVRNEEIYKFEMSYTLNGQTVNPNRRQPVSYDKAKRKFVEDYVQDHKPKTVEDSYMSFGDIISKTLKLGWYSRPMSLPIGNIPFLATNVTGAIRDAAKEYVFKGIKVIPKIARKVKFEIGYAMNHNLNDNSLIQQTKDYKYKLEAEGAFDKEVKEYSNAYSRLLTFINIDTSGYSKKRLEQYQRTLQAAKNEYEPKLKLLDDICAKLNLPKMSVILSDLAKNADSYEKVHDEYVDMYVQYRREGQLLGYGIIGNIKQTVKAIGKSRLAQAIAVPFKVTNILLNGGANQGKDKEERKAKLIESLKRKAEYAWSKLFRPSFDENGDIIKDSDGDIVMEPADENIVKLVHELYDNAKGKSVLWSDLSKGEQEAIHDVFIQRFVQGRYNKLMEPLFSGPFKIEKWAAKTAIGIKWLGAKVMGAVGSAAKGIKKFADREKLAIIKDRVISDAIKHNDERLDEIAVDKYSKKYNELSDDEKKTVNNLFYVKYGAEITTYKGLLGYKLRNSLDRKSSKLAEKAKSLTEKSGVKNAFQGKLDAARAWKEKQQERDNTIGRFFDIMDARRAKKDKQKFEGKKDSKLARILKWLFVGGVAVPLVVGMIKDDVLPAVKEKVAPWLKKAKDKIFGVKDETTGEYKGGIISGIVNPVRNFFKSKFDKIHRWIHNEGEYNDKFKGLSGVWENLKKVGNYLIERWKDGATTIYGDFIPKLAFKIGEHALPILQKILEGLGSYISKKVHGDEQAEFDTSSVTGLGKEDSLNYNGYSDQLNTGFGKQVDLSVPSSKVGIPNLNTSTNPNLLDNERKINEDGTVDITTKNTDTNETKTTTSKSFKPNEMYKSHKLSDGTQVYKNNSGDNKEYIKDEETGTYVLLQDFMAIQNKKLAESRESINKETANQAEMVDYKKDDSIGSAALKGVGKYIFAANNAAIRLSSKTSTAGAANALVHTSAKKLGSVATKTAAGVSAVSSIGGIGTKTGGLALYGGTKVGTIATEATRNATFTTQARLYEVIGNVMGKCGKFIADGFKKVFNSSACKRLLGENISKHAGEIADDLAEKTVELMTKESGPIAERALSKGALLVAKAIPIIFVVSSFIDGWNDAQNILGILTKPTFGQRFISAILKAIPEVIINAGCSLVLAGGVGGKAVGLGLTAVGACASALLEMYNVRESVIEYVIDILGKYTDMEKFKKDRQDAKNIVSSFNTANNLNLNVSEYIKSSHRNLSDRTTNVFTAMAGSDGETKSGITDRVSTVGRNKKAKSVGNRLADMFATVWQQFSSDFLREDEEFYDYDNTVITDKKRIERLRNARYVQVTTKITDQLIELLNKQEDILIDTVESRAYPFGGFGNKSQAVVTWYNKGSDNPSEQFNIDEEYQSWKLVKAMAGICSIVNFIFKPIANKKLVTKIIVSNMVPVYFNESGVRQWAEKLKNAKGNNEGIEFTVDTSQFESGGSTESQIATNAKTNNKLTPINIEQRLIGGSDYNLKTHVSDTISNAINSITGGGMGNISEVIKSLREKNKQINRKIDALRLLPTDDEYWNIIVDDKHPFASSLFSFTENISRVIKAPFALAASMNMNTAKILSSNSAVTSGTAANVTSNTSGSVTNTAKDNSSATTSNTKNSSSGIVSKLWSGLKSTVGKLFGRGKGDTDETDPDHIYQRDFNDSYNVSGDSERQTIADSGCGPASAASVLRIYGKKGSMRNAANYALRNKYKEKDGGTYPEYFNDYLNSNGISTNSNATNVDVINNLANGKPVILMGKNTGKSANTPYGNKYSHYVVAKGIDKNGNVIVEDSEDKRGNTRYSLADTLKNTSVRITTGSGKYGRASEDMSVNDRYISNVNAVISGTVSSTIAAAINGAMINSGLVTTGTTSDKSDDTKYGNINGDAKAAIGKSYTATLEGETMTLTMDKGGAEIYTFLTDECGCSTAAACGVMGNWVQECGGHTIENIKPVALKGQITYGGGLMQWTPPDYHIAWANQHGYSDPWEWEAQLAHVKDELSENSTDWSTTRIGNYADQMRAQGFSVCNTTSEFKALTDPEDAAVNFERGLEGSADFDGRSAEGPIYYAHLYDFNRRLAALAVYGLVTGKSDSKSGKGKVESFMGKSKFGRAADDNTTNTADGPKTFKEMISDGVNKAKETVSTIKNNTNTSDENTTTEEDAVTEEKKTDKTKSSTSASNEETKGLISLLGKYTKKLTKGIFGSFYDALYGNEVSSDTTTSGTTTSASYNGNDVVYAAAMVFEALGRANPGGIYDNGGGTYFDLECKDGTKIEHVRPDCSGLMTAVLQYMGYYTYSCGKTFSETYHGEGLNDQHMKPEEFSDIDGNPTKDFEIVQTSSGVGKDKAVAGDIRVTSGHTDMFCYYDKNGSARGFNAGHTDGMKASYKLADKYFSDGNKLPTDEYGDFTISDGSTSWVLRYKGSGSGRGKKKLDLAKLNRKPRRNYILTDKGKIYVSEINAKKNSKLNPHYGRSVWGRDGEDEQTTLGPKTLTDTLAEKANESNQTVSSDFTGPLNENQTRENTTEETENNEETKKETSKTTTSNTSSSDAKSLISKLSSYTSKIVKGVYGKFYYALYGNENQQVVAENGDNVIGSGTAGCLNNAIPYSTYSIWKQSWPSSNGPTWNCDVSWNTKHVISIDNYDIGSSGCSLVSTALMLAHSGVVQEASFDPAKLADDVNTRPECADICGGQNALTHVCEYKGNKTMQFVSDDQWSFGGKSFDEIYNYVVSSMQQGYFLIGHVTNHYCCIDYVDTAHKVIFIMDPAFNVNCWYDSDNKPDVLTDEDKGYTMYDQNFGNEFKKIEGVVRYKSSTTNASAYLLNGRRSFDSLHPNGGAPNATISGEGKYGRAHELIKYPKNYKRQGPQRLPDGTYVDADGSTRRNIRSFTAYENKKNSASGRGKSSNTSRTYGRAVNDTYYGNTGLSHNNSNYHGSTHGSITNSNYHGTNRYTNSNNFDELLNLITIIANNSDKMDSLLTILGNIAVNTENTAKANSTIRTNNTKQNTPKNGLAALRTALDSGNNGQDIINAIYQIAKS